MLKFSPDVWTLHQKETEVELIYNMTNCMITCNHVQAKKLVQVLSPESINHVITLDPGAPLCTCFESGGMVNCQTRFSFDDVFQVRKIAYLSPDSVQFEGDRLKQLNGSHVDRKTSPRSTEKQSRTTYFVGSRKVCRRYYQSCLGFSKEQVNQVSNLACGKKVTNIKKIRVVQYARKVTKERMCVSFFEYFFAVCQRPNDDVRLFPANQSLDYIYHQVFWPWWLHIYKNQLEESVFVFEGDPQVAEELRSTQPITPISNNTNPEPTSVLHKIFLKHGIPIPIESGNESGSEEEDHKERRGAQVEHRGAPPQEGELEEWEEEECCENEVDTKPLHPFKYTSEFPSLSTFKTVRWKFFPDVKRRPKHLHCRCATCYEVMTLMLKAMNTGINRDLYEKRAKQHYAEVYNWRNFECVMFDLAKHSNGATVVLSYDDTSAFGFPHFTKREIKNMTTVRMRVIPFNLTNHGTHENFYVYTIYNMYQKGANRLCSTLYHYLKRMKWMEPRSDREVANGQQKASRLVIMADNYGENKNNYVFAFISELVLRGWFTKVELYYGPVGHTHNGNDAVHYIHNQIAGNQVSITLAEFFMAFDVSWKNEHTRPQPIILDVVYDWEQYYDDHLHRIKNFTKTRNCQSYCRAFKVERHTNGVVQMHVKGSPSDPNWYGEHGQLGNPGFTMLRTLPKKLPSIISPSECGLGPALLSHLRNPNITRFCEHEQLYGSHEWLLKFATTGRVPTLGLVTPEQLKDKDPKIQGWDFVEEIGVRPRVRPVPFIRRNPEINNIISWWSLPKHIVQFDVPAPTVIPDYTCPDVHYLDDKPLRQSKKQKRREEKQTEGSEIEDSDDSQAGWLPDGAGVDEVKRWGPKFELCVPGHFAIMEVTYCRKKNKKDIPYHKGITVIEVFSSLERGGGAREEQSVLHQTH